MDGLVQHEVGTVAASRSEVPLLALAEQHAPLHSEILDAWSRILRAGAFVNGPEVAAFEEEFAAVCEVRSCVAVSTGTDALILALRALGTRSEPPASSQCTSTATRPTWTRLPASPLTMAPGSSRTPPKPTWPVVGAGE